MSSHRHPMSSTISAKSWQHSRRRRPVARPRSQSTGRWSTTPSPGWPGSSSPERRQPRAASGQSADRGQGAGVTRSRFIDGGVGVAVIGCGSIGSLRAQIAHRHPSVDYLAVCDVVEERARQTGRCLRGRRLGHRCHRTRHQRSGRRRHRGVDGGRPLSHRRWPPSRPAKPSWSRSPSRSFPMKATSFCSVPRSTASGSTPVSPSASAAGTWRSKSTSSRATSAT